MLAFFYNKYLYLYLYLICKFVNVVSQKQHWRPNWEWSFIISGWSTTVANRAFTLFSNCCSIIKFPTRDKTLFSRLAAEKWAPQSHETLMIPIINREFSASPSTSYIQIIVICSLSNIIIVTLPGFHPQKIIIFFS